MGTVWHLRFEVLDLEPQVEPAKHMSQAPTWSENGHPAALKKDKNESEPWHKKAVWEGEGIDLEPQVEPAKHMPHGRHIGSTSCC